MTQNMLEYLCCTPRVAGLDYHCQHRPNAVLPAPRVAPVAPKPIPKNEVSGSEDAQSAKSTKTKKRSVTSTTTTKSKESAIQPAAPKTRPESPWNLDDAQDDEDFAQVDLAAPVVTSKKPQALRRSLVGMPSVFVVL
jgi:hypothetical protein